MRWIQFLAAPSDSAYWPCGFHLGNSRRHRLMSSRSIYRRRSIMGRAAMVGLLILAGASSGWAKDKWDPVPAADLAAKESTSSPGADVEILQSRQVIDQDYDGPFVEHYLRAKIYTAKGAEDWGNYRAEVPPIAKVKYVSGRVTKPNGTVIDLEKSDIHETVLLKYDNEKWKQTAFAFPNLSPGDVLECRWTVAVHGWLYSYQDFIQEAFPVHEFRFRVESFPSKYWFEWRNCVGAKLETEDRTRMTLVVKDIPPFEKEENMPPEWDFRAGFMLIRNDAYDSDAELWQSESRAWSEGFDDYTTVGGLKPKAAALIAGAKTDDEKLQRLYDFCQREIGNLQATDTAEAKAIRDKRENGRRIEAHTAAQTLEQRTGWPYEIDYLFAGLARASGFEVKRTQSASRAEVLNVKTEKGWGFLWNTRVAVKVAGAWRFFDPGSYWVPYGMLNWTDEGVTALLCDDSKVLYETTPQSAAEKSQLTRKGRFRLDAEGTLDGEVEEAFTGHEGIELKSRNADKASDEIDRDFRDRVAKRLPAAEVTDLHWENLRTHDFPVTVSYKVHVPGYAEQAGKRLIVAPGYFEAGRPERFSEEKRKLPIFFSYAKEEHDDIEIILPEGFELDHPSAPANVAAQEKTIGASYRTAYNPKQRLLTYRRDFVLGGNQAITFQAESYPVLKKRFERLHQSDTHALILKIKTVAEATPAAPTPAGP